MKHRLTRPGTVMLELLVAILLIGTSIMAVYMAMIFAYTTSIRAHHYTRASQIASQEIEIIRSLNPANLTTPYNGAFVGTTDPVSELPSGTANLTTSYTNPPTNTIKQAVVTVSWVDRGLAKSVRYSTLVVDQGLYQ